MTRVPFFDRTRRDAAAEGELVSAFLRVVRSGHYILGGEVEAFERACAEVIGVPHAIGVSSGTDALLVALLALGVGPGDEVICPAYTFFATAGAIARTGATPVFADVDPATYTLDPASAAARLGPRTKAIVPVHLFGRCADMTALASVASSIPLVEDAAQAFGATHHGRQAGAVGALGCFSFFPTKNLGGFGDGGLVTTRDAEVAAKVRALRAHGARVKHQHTWIGGNFRLDALQAALLGVALAGVPASLARRAAIAARYRALFTEAGLAGEGGKVELPPAEGTFNQFVIRVRGERDRLRAFLAGEGIGTEIYYPLPLHFQPCFAGLGHAPGSFPAAEAAARETLALPVFPELDDGEIAAVVEAIGRFFRAAP